MAGRLVACGRVGLSESRVGIGIGSCGRKCFERGEVNSRQLVMREEDSSQLHHPDKAARPAPFEAGSIAADAHLAGHP